jgi:hypothetical protein
MDSYAACGRTACRRALAALLVALLPSAGRASIMLGQIDTFQDGTTQNWGNGSPIRPTNVPNGGPGGAGDAFMDVMSTGNDGPGGRLTVQNHDQWSGNYLAAGVSVIEMDLKNFGTDDLLMRVALKQAHAMSAAGFVSTDPFVLPADNAWHHAVFPLDDAHLTRVNSDTLTLDQLLSDVGELRLLHSLDASVLQGEQVPGEFGADNILAGPSPAPEPGGLALALSGLPVLAAYGYRRRRRARPATA